MILHDEFTIRRYTDEGFWSESRTLLTELDDAVRQHPDRVAYVDPPDRPALLGTQPGSVTWREFGERVQNLAAALTRMGLEKDRVVVVQLPNVWELPLLYFAIATAGGITSPVPMQWRQNDITYISELTNAQFFIGAETFKGTTQSIVANLEDAALFERILDITQISALAVEPPADGAPVVADPDPNDVFSICWTSGTESRPKGCPMSHNTWSFASTMVVGALCLSEDSFRQISVAPLTNMLGVCLGIVGNLRIGGTAVLHHPLNLALLKEQITAQDLHFLILPPAVLHQLLDMGEDAPDLRGVESIMTGGAPPAAALIEGYQDRWGVEVVNAWGMNEGAGLFAGPDDIPEVERRTSHFPWYGVAGVEWPSGVTGHELKVVDRDGRALTEDGAVGELLVRCPSVFPGYYARPDLTGATFDEDGFLKTGDLFQIRESTYLSFYDREKDIIIRGGFNISAAEVESLARGIPGVADCAAVGYPDEVLGERLCLVIVPQDPTNPPSLESVVSHLRVEGMSIYKLPERLETWEELPRNPTGKLLKRVIRESV